MEYYILDTKTHTQTIPKIRNVPQRGKKQDNLIINTNKFRENNHIDFREIDPIEFRKVTNKSIESSRNPATRSK